MKAKPKKPHPWTALITAIILILLGIASVWDHFIPKKPEIRPLWDSWRDLKVGILTYQSEAIHREYSSLDTVSRQKAIYSFDSASKRHWPPSLEALVPQYLKAIPCDPNGSQKVVTVYDGTGGWVYNPQTGDVMPNVPVARAE